jgi:serine/threonine protein kinase/class 3 adenylate cyclase
MSADHQVDELLKARAEIDEQLRKHKDALTVLFTDVVGSTSYFERNGDTAGLVMIHRHDDLVTRAIAQFNGKVIKTIGDSAMAEFPDPASAVRAAVEIERQFLKLNLTLLEDQRVEVRIGVHTGVGFRKGNDLFGDVVNVASRIVRRTASAQILISRAMYDAVSTEQDLHCRWLHKLTIDGRTEKEDIYEVVWTDVDAYRDIQERMASSTHIPPRYEVLGQIGTGGTGIVYKVRDLETSEIVALKVLKPEIASDPDVQENLKRELLLARKITHKNVCRIHEFSRFNGAAYTTMEFVEGECLAARLSRLGALPIDEALDIARQICDGLREAHTQGIVHRDLKPGNILVDRSGTVKIMDFGIARMIQRDGPMTGTIVGTPAYMAPEQAELKPLSAQTDIYAVGLLLYEMITGVPAFDGDSPVAVALKQIRDYPKRPREIVPQLTRAVESVIMKCLQKEPVRRFVSVTELEIALLRASKARNASPWEVTLNRSVDRAEAQIRKCLCLGLEHAQALAERQNWQQMKLIQKDPKAMLGVTGIVSALAVFMIFGAWKPRTTNAQSVPLANRSAAAMTSAAGPYPEFRTLPTPNSLAPLASHEVNLYADTSASSKASASSVFLDEVDVTETPAAKSPQSNAKPQRGSSALKPAAHAVQSKPRSNDAVVPVPAALANPAQPQVPAATSAPKPAAAESATASAASQPAESVLPSTGISKSATSGTAGNDESKTAKIFVEVGSFKDETWADSAVEKLTHLGFRAVILHKNLLWKQSFHVQVGPYPNPKDAADARESLAAQGFKGHLVN